MKVKICGITNLEDAVMCEELGADAIGFVHYPGRQRSLPLTTIAEMIGLIGPMTQKVLVCNPGDLKEATELFEKSRADVLQVYSLSAEDLQGFREFGGRIIRAVKPDVAEVKKFVNSADALLFEAGEPGTGSAYDYSCVPTEHCRRSIIAGGLNIGNINLAKTRKPYALDVSSGVESSIGKKDSQLVAEFIKRCKE
jgi:phosphoribosylanthranilate isomerase